MQRAAAATGGNKVGIVVPEEIVQSFDRGKRVPVVVTIDGDYTYKTTIGVMGGRFLASFERRDPQAQRPRRRRRGGLRPRSDFDR